VTHRTAATSVARVFSRPANLAALSELLRELRERFPGAIIDRYLDKVPVIGGGGHVFPTAVVVGDVRIAEGVSLWYGAVLRGDINYISVGCV
jgi:hypothetical protein